MENFFLIYRTTPHSVTDVPPCELLMGSSLQTRWNLLKSDVEKRVQLCQTFSTGQEISLCSCLGIGSDHAKVGTSYLLGGCVRWAATEASCGLHQRIQRPTLCPWFPTWDGIGILFSIPPPIVPIPEKSTISPMTTTVSENAPLRSVGTSFVIHSSSYSDQP